MATSANLALRFNESDKAALVKLSDRLHLSQNEVVRRLVRTALTTLEEHDQAHTKRVSAQAPGAGRSSQHG